VFVEQDAPSQRVAFVSLDACMASQAVTNSVVKQLREYAQTLAQPRPKPHPNPELVGEWFDCVVWCYFQSVHPPQPT
jgi:hypothetical protein